LFCRNLFIINQQAASPHTPQFYRHRFRRASRPIPGPSTATRSESVIAVNFAKKAGPHWQHQLRGRDEEVDLQHLELPSLPLQGRTADALFGECGRGGRRRAVSSGLSGTGKTHPVERPSTAA